MRLTIMERADRAIEAAHALGGAEAWESVAAAEVANTDPWDALAAKQAARGLRITQRVVAKYQRALAAARADLSKALARHYIKRAQ